MRRLETLVLMGGTGLPSSVVREQLASAIDVVVQMVRAPSGVRQVAAVARVERDPARGWRLDPVGKGAAS
jgi:pilus assembly protein CpaF